MPTSREVYVSLYKPHPPRPTQETSSPRRAQTTIEGLLAQLSGPPEVVSNKYFASAWSPISYRDGQRLAECAESICALVYDIDDSEFDWDAVDSKLGELNWVCLVHSTYTPGHARLILPLARDLTPAEYRSTYERIGAQLGLAYDRSCSDLARLFFSPSCAPGTEELHNVQRGGSILCDPGMVIEAKPPAPALSIAPPAQREEGSLDLEALRSDIKARTNADTRQRLLALVDGTLEFPPGTRHMGGHRLLCSLAQLRHAPTEEQMLELMRRVLQKRPGAKESLGKWLEEAARSYQKGLGYRQGQDLPKAMIGLARSPKELEAQGKKWMSEKLIERQDRQGNHLGYDSCFTNLVHVLLNDPEYAGMLRLNVLRNDIEVTRGPLEGCDSESLPGRLSVLLQDSDYKFTPPLAPSRVAEAILSVAQQNPYDPVREYLIDLPEWDGIPRLNNLLLLYANARGSEDWIRLITGKFFIAAVARAMDPGCQVDTVLLLQGGQGGGKTSLVRTMGGPYAVEMHLDVRNKDAIMAATQNWIVELSELAGLNSSDTESTRSFISRNVDEMRLPYGRVMRKFSRRCVFIGTTNSAEPLKDPEGTRRFWPVSVGKVDVAGIAAIRDQLWAEALHRYEENEPWWLTQEESVQAEMEADIYRERDPWADQISSTIYTQQPRPETVNYQYIYDLLGVPVEKRNSANQARLRHVLKHQLKWKLGHEPIEMGTGRMYFYRVPPETQAPSEEITSSKKEKKQ